MKADPLVSLHANLLFSGRACSCKKDPCFRPPFCLLSAQTRRSPFFDRALPEGQPNKNKFQLSYTKTVNLPLNFWKCSSIFPGDINVEFFVLPFNFKRSPKMRKCSFLILPGLPYLPHLIVPCGVWQLNKVLTMKQVG